MATAVSRTAVLSAAGGFTWSVTFDGIAGAQEPLVATSLLGGQGAAISVATAVPGNSLGGTRSASEYGYASGTILGSPGHVRVRVAPEVATVDFVRASLGDAGGGRQEKEANGAVVASYQVKPGAVRPASKGASK